MLEKRGVTCDECGGYHEFDTQIFSQRIQEIKDIGWLIKKVPQIDAWFHYCHDCKPKPQQRTRWYDQD